MRTMLKPVSTLLIALSLALGTVAVASAQDSGEVDLTTIGVFCLDPACPGDACGLFQNNVCTRVSGVFSGMKCTCKVIIA